MGARGRLAEYPERIPVYVSKAQKCMLEALAGRRGEPMAGVVRTLIENEWRATHARAAQEDRSE